MIKKIRKKLLATALSAMMIAALIPYGAPLTVHGETPPVPLSEPDPRVLLQTLSAVEDDFNRATVDWDISGGTAEAVTTLSVSPYSVFEGSRSLALTAAEDTITIARKPKSVTSGEDFRFFAVAVWAPADAGTASLTLAVTAKENRYEQTVSLLSGRWQAVFFDLTDSALTGAVSSLSLTLQAQAEGQHRFLLDCLGAADSDTAVFTVRHLAPSYRAEGCTLSITESGSMAVTLSGYGQYLEAEAPALTDFSGGTGIRVRLKNNSSCRSLTLRYTTLSATAYTEKRSYTVQIPQSEDVVSCLFSIPESYIGQFRLEFDGVPTGSVEILSITAVPCYTGSTTSGTVSECLLSRDQKSLSVKGSMAAEDAEKYADCALYLYELSPWEEQSAISTARTAVAETMLNGTEFSFSLPLSDSREALFHKYAVMIYYAGGLIPVGSSRFITNPERLASETKSVSLTSRKGCWPLTGDYLFDGIACTTVEILLEDLVSLSDTDTLHHTSGTASCSFDAAYVEALDKQMRDYATCGVQVYFLLRLSSPDDLSLSELLCHPGAEGGRYVAFNTTNENGINALRAICDFLTTRYSTQAGVSQNLAGYVVGSAVNNAADSYNMGSAGLTTFAKAYSNALRVVYNTVQSIASGLEIYMPLGGDWYSAMTTGQTASFDARSTLEAVSACLRAGGDIDWKLSYDIAPEKGHYAWEEDEPEAHAEASRLTINNLNVLMTYLANDTLLYNGSSRTVLLMETEPWEAEDENTYIRLSADYVYTYLRLASRTFASVKAYLPAHPVNYSGVLTYIDTNRFSEITAFAAELLGFERFNTLLPEASSVVNRYVNENTATTVIPSAVKGEKILFAFADDTAGWYGTLNCASLKSGTSSEGQNDLLSVRFASASPETWRGVAVDFEQPLDLSQAPYLGFTCRSAILPEGVEELELAVVITAGSHQQISTLRLQAGTDTTVVADLSSFPGRTACDGMAIYIKGVDGTDIGEPTLLIGAIRAMSEKHSDADLDKVIRLPQNVQEEIPTVALTTVIAVGAVGLLALILESIRIIRRRAENRIDEE